MRLFYYLIHLITRKHSPEKCVRTTGRKTYAFHCGKCGKLLGQPIYTPARHKSTPEKVWRRTAGILVHDRIAYEHRQFDKKLATNN